MHSTQKLISESELSAILGLSVRCLQDWRAKGIGPPFVKMGFRSIRYDFSEIEKWLQDPKVKSTRA